MEQAQRLGHGGGAQHLLQRHLAAELGLGVPGTVAVVLHRHPGQVLLGGAEAVHVGAGDHGVEPREGHPVVDLRLLVRGGGEDLRDVRAVGHLLDAGGQHQVAEARRHLHEAQPQGHSSRGAGRLHPGGGHPGHPKVIGHQGAQVLLAHELPARHVAHVEGVHAVGTGAGERPPGRFHEEIPQARLPQLAEPGHPGADDGHFAHELLLPAVNR